MTQKSDREKGDRNSEVREGRERELSFEIRINGG